MRQQPILTALSTDQLPFDVLPSDENEGKISGAQAAFHGMSVLFVIAACSAVNWLVA